MRFLTQYKNLSKEIYVLFFGRVVTSMGALIWPIMTLILKNKLGYSATTIAAISMVMTIVEFPMIILGGKLADSVNRKKIIVFCDLVTVACYLISAAIPLSAVSVGLFYIAGLFATIEGPSYDALVADLSDTETREHAYSLQYLGMNLGLVMAPTIGGLLFEHYLNLAFAITGVATFSSTLLIILFIKRLSVEKKNISKYEEKQEGVKAFAILKERKALLIYFLAAALGNLVYSQFNYLLPLHMEGLYGSKGAALFGMMTSVNAIVVVIGTPLITTFLFALKDVRKLLVGETLIVVGLVSYAFSGRLIPVYFFLMVVFTLGEIFNTLASSPYMTRRVPSTHWGRFNSMINILCMTFYSVGNLGVGKLVDTYGFKTAWGFVGIIGALTISLILVLNIVDKKSFPLLYRGGTSKRDEEDDKKSDSGIIGETTTDETESEGAPMIIIAGLGNPGKDYEGTRHNMGFRTIDLLGDKYGIDVSTGKFHALIGKGVIEGQKVLLMKPLTYMNKSGESIAEAVAYFKADPETELIVISDDVTLEPGMIRVRKKGSAGGHNGLKDIIAHLQTEGFPRVRVGVGKKPPRMDLADFVLGHFPAEEREAAQEGIKKAAEAVKIMLTDGADAAMNVMNQKNKAE